MATCGAEAKRQEWCKTKPEFLKLKATLEGETKSKFIPWKTFKDFGSSDIENANHRIQWSSLPGHDHPHIIVQTEWYKEQEKKSKKQSCPRTIVAKEILFFTDHVTSISKYKKEKTSKVLKETVAKKGISTIRTERKILIEWPCQEYTQVEDEETSTAITEKEKKRPRKRTTEKETKAQKAKDDQKSEEVTCTRPSLDQSKVTERRKTMQRKTTKTTQKSKEGPKGKEKAKIDKVAEDDKPADFENETVESLHDAFKAGVRLSEEKEEKEEGKDAGDKEKEKGEEKEKQEEKEEEQQQQEEEEKDGDNDDAFAEEDDVFDENINPPTFQDKPRLPRRRGSKNSVTEMSPAPEEPQNRVFDLCGQKKPVSFTVALSRTVLQKSKKIGEGVYGEVYRSYRKGRSVAIKIIPIEGDFPVNDEPQKKFEEILPEIIIAKELSDLRNSESSTTSSFCELMNVSCVKGKYPTALLRQWDDFKRQKTSENDRPDMFKDDQLYIVFEFADCGTALEAYKLDNLQKAKSILTQVTFALAAAEDSLMFEHRDLHWGNVLVRPTDEEEIMYKIDNETYRVPTMGLEANIIDFTLSRLTKDGCKIYSNLAKDEALFQGSGDIQFDVYRNMKEKNGNNWAEFHPYTNVLWLHYLADKLIYRNTKSVKSREERDTLRQFRQFLVEMLNFKSANEMAKKSAFFGLKE